MGPRYWYSTQPTVTKLAEDRAEQLKRDPDQVLHELEQRLRADLKKSGEFGRVHALPRTGADVPDDLDARLVVLGPDQPYGKEPGSAAELAAKTILETRGNAPRLYRNSLVFLAVDKVRWQDLDEAIRRYLAWQSILAEREALNLDPHQVRQAETQKQAADSAVTARLPEAYQWLLVPVQKDAAAPTEWQAIRLSGADALAVRASKKLKNEELLIANFGPTRLRMELDRVPLWRGDHVAVRQLAEDFARYPYLPRLAGPEVLAQAVREGVALLTWERDAFAYAESFDEAVGRYRGLRAGAGLALGDDAPGLLVKPEVARRQMDAEAAAAGAPAGSAVAEPGAAARPGAGPVQGAGDRGAQPLRPRRFHGTVSLDPARVGRDAGRIAEEVIAHLQALPGAQVRVTLEIDAEIPAGAPEHVVRTVTENSRTLKFTSAGFEAE